MPEVSVIVPTYCEAENLPFLVPRVCHALRVAGIEGEIVVVDDNSPDGTRAVCRQLAVEHPVRLLVRENERGLSGAVVAGMDVAEGDLLLVMDADLSHPPEKIPQMVSALKEGWGDFVIGSRYVQGGSTDEGWGVLRWLNSQAATLLARPLTSARDPMAGFFCLRRSDFQKARDTLNPIGYKIGLELIVKCGCHKVVEIPIAFSDRMYGTSKLGVREQWNYLRHLKRLYEHRFRNWAYFGEFAAVGTSGTLVDLATFAGLIVLMPTGAARALAIWMAMTWNFLLNRTFTFSYARQRPLIRQYFGFSASCAVGAVLNFSASMALCTFTAFFAEWKVPAAAVGVLVGTASNFLFCRYVVFRQHRRAHLTRRASSTQPSEASTEARVTAC